MSASSPFSARLVRIGAITGALLCAVSVAAGAFGAHGLQDRLDAQGLDRWSTASRYLMYAGVGAVLAGLAARRSPPAAGFRPRAAAFAAVALVLGGVVFSVALYALALGAPGLFGAVAPLGGSAMIAGFVALGVALGARSERQP
ncbi:MAG: DUF423 domain-containing protein [Holophagales bacterium]|nr:DUF423 domain-containing protein [Holophagales bacterium]